MGGGASAPQEELDTQLWPWAPPNESTPAADAALADARRANESAWATLYQWQGARILRESTRRELALAPDASAVLRPRGQQSAAAIATVLSVDEVRIATAYEASDDDYSPAAAGVRAAAEWTIAPDELRLRERVAVGGFAEVFRGTWNGTTVAVKQLLERGPDVVDRLREEVLTLCRLRHPNLLLFMGWCADPPLIATEFMRRGSLHSILRGNGGHLGAPRTHHAAVSVAKGMQYLHSRAPPILHLDLKSPNILVDDKWRVKIADFGLARARRNTLVSGRSGFHGTPEWMAPEMLRAEDYDEKADSYSYGVVLWELLAAQTPWNELHPMQVVAVVGYSDRRLTLPPEARDFAGENLVTRALADLFWECASKSPIARPGFDEILERLERAPGMLLPGPEPDPSATTQTPPRRAAVQHIAGKANTVDDAGSRGHWDILHAYAAACGIRLAFVEVSGDAAAFLAYALEVDLEEGEDEAGEAGLLLPLEGLVRHDVSSRMLSSARWVRGEERRGFIRGAARRGWRRRCWRGAGE